MDKDKLEQLVHRFGSLFEKNKDFYAMDYGDRFNPKVNEKTGKIEFGRDENGKKGFWYVDNPVNPKTYWKHLENTGKGENGKTIDWGLIMAPVYEITNECKFGAIDVDVYNKPDEIKRIVSEIYDQKLPLVPCSSKSGGLHIYLFLKNLSNAQTVINYLTSINKKLKIHAKEIFPKQTLKLQLKGKRKGRYNIGNGILLPYKSVVHSTEGSYEECSNKWIMNSRMETGDLEEFINWGELKQIETGDLPIDIIEKEEKKTDPIFKNHSTDFKEQGARPLDDSLKKILNNIRQRKDHDRGGTFDNHVVDYVFSAVENSYSDKEIIDNFEPVREFSEKSKEPDYIEDKIKNCREKYDKEDPGELKNQMMSNLIYLKNSDTFRDQSTGGDYKKAVVDTIYSHLFPKRTTAVSYFNNTPNKQMAEMEIYRPDLYEEGKLLFINKQDNLFYINKYKPGNYPPIKPEKQSDIEKWDEMVEFIVEDESERDYLLNWLAFIIQKPWVKTHAMILIYTKNQRMGKGSIFDVMTDILGLENAEPTDIDGIMDKGVMFADKQLILVDEAETKGTYSETKHVSNALKKLGTERRIQQRKLYTDYKAIETHTNYMIFTNNPGALNLDEEDDRVFIVSNYKPRREQKFYDDFHKWRIEIGSSYVHYILKHRDISKFNHTAPPPRTKAKADMVGQLGHPLTLVLKQLIEEGQHPFPLDQSVRGSTELSDWISKHGRGDWVRFANNPKVLAQCLEEAGCFKVGQAHNDKFNLNATLWIYRDHEEMKKWTPKDLSNRYWKPLITTATRVELVEAKLTEDLQNRDPNCDENIFYEQKMGFKQGRETVCWSCKVSISESGDGICPECDYAIKCSCGMCACDKPDSKIQKKGAYETR